MSSGRVSLADFYVRRARRILPAAVLTLVATSIAAHQLLNFVRAKDVVEDSIWASLFAANIHCNRRERLLRPGPAPVADSISGRSRSRQFYFVWPAVFSLVLFGALFGRSLRGRRSGARPPVGPRAVRRLLIVVLLVGAASLAWSIHSTDASASAAYFSTPPAPGSWRSAPRSRSPLRERHESRRPCRSASAGWGSRRRSCGCSLLRRHCVPGLRRALADGRDRARDCGRAGARPESARGRPRPVPSAARYVGDRSYAFYLWHWPVLIIAAQYAGHELSLQTRPAALRCVPPLHRQLRDRREPAASHALARLRSARSRGPPRQGPSWPSRSSSSGRSTRRRDESKPRLLLSGPSRSSTPPRPRTSPVSRRSRYRRSWRRSVRRSKRRPFRGRSPLPSATSAETSTASRGCTPRGGCDEEPDLPPRRRVQLEDDRRHR